MALFFPILSFFWIIRTIKSILFWLYLWQLKEYHLGRFLDHFRTEKGKRLLLNKILIFKYFSLLILSFRFFSPPSFYNQVFFGAPLILFFLLLLYTFESIRTFHLFFQKKLRGPVLTLKILFLIFLIGILTILFLFALLLSIKKTGDLIIFVFYLLLFDVLVPLITSGVVLMLQPLVLLKRKQILRQAKEKRENFKDLIVIGISGSYGKTSTKEFLYQILSEKFGKEKVLKTKEHINAEIGIAQTILKELNENHQIFVCEIGAYNCGKIKEVCSFLQPQIGILTGINEQHMATFGSQENIIKAKFELIESLPEDGLAVINSDNEFINLKLRAKSEKPKLKTKNLKFYSTKEMGDIFAKDIKIEKEWISFRAISKDGDEALFRVNLLGYHNVSNLLAASLVAKEKFGLSLSEISKICQRFKPEMGTMVLKRIDDLNIIDSTYSANPDGVISALDYLRVWQNCKKIIVIPCLIELGKASKEVHKKIGRKIGQICDLAIITNKERFEEIKEGAKISGMKEENILFFEDPEKILKKIKEVVGAGDVILLEGRIPQKIIELIEKMTL